jgi:hypothetical protein
LDALRKASPFHTLLMVVITFIAAYYACILLHEWLGHGFAAWLMGEKSSPFDIYYGGWGLLHVDENVNYDKLVSAGRGAAGAFIAINATVVTGLFFILSLILLPRPSIQKNKIIFTFFYWALIINMVPLLQYFTLTAFSREGDVGQFTRGLKISPWWVFIPGTMIVIAALWRIFKFEVPRAYVVIPITRLWPRRIFLGFTLFVIFLLIYTHRYNPLTDSSTNMGSKLLALTSIILAPILLFLCDPSRYKKM